MKILVRLFVLYFFLSNLTLNAAQSDSLQSLKSASQTKYKPDTSVLVTPNTVVLQMDNIAHVQFAGIPASDTTSNGRPILYSGAAGLVGVFAQIMVHAAIEQGIQNSAEVKAQQQADKVLEPYLSTIDTISPESLKSRCLTQCKDETRSIFAQSDSIPDPTNRILESHPIFLMSQDRKNLILRNIVVLQAPSNSTEHNKKQDIKPRQPLYQNVIEVVSDPIDDSSTKVDSLDGDNLAELAGKMFNTSIDLAAADLLHQLENLEESDRTFKYELSGSTSYERGRLLKSEENRLSIRTLRGWIKSIPIQQAKQGKGTTTASNEVEPKS